MRYKNVHEILKALQNVNPNYENLRKAYPTLEDFKKRFKIADGTSFYTK